MKENMYLAACDMGASSGRVLLGCFDGNKLTTREVHRFDNNYYEKNGVLYWDIQKITSELAKGLSFANAAAGGNLECFGVDTWGVDYGLIDKHGKLIEDPRSYRYSQDEDMSPVFDRIPLSDIYAGTGIAAQSYNTLFQLYKRKMQNDSAFQNAETLLMTPDLIGYLLTGEKGTEYSIATTSMMLDPYTKQWNYGIIEKLGLPSHILTNVDRPGTLRGKVLPEIAERIGSDKVKYAAVGCHDTASAVAAIPGQGNFAFLSSGTWSLFGIEKDTVTINDEVINAGISNEGTVQYGFRLLKNIMGMWIIQEARRKWQLRGENYSWDEITAMAAKEKPLRSIIDPDYTEFFNSSDIENSIRNYCKNTGQPQPETIGQMARCIYESLALKYRWALEYMEHIKGCRIDSINIVGGGIQNRLLNQMTADSTDRPVVTGPIESASSGNILTQAMALGELRNVEEIRNVVRNSVETETFASHHTAEWDDAYDRLKKYIKMMEK